MKVGAILLSAMLLVYGTPISSEFSKQLILDHVFSLCLCVFLNISFGHYGLSTITNGTWHVWSHQQLGIIVSYTGR